MQKYRENIWNIIELITSKQTIVNKKNDQVQIIMKNLTDLLAQQ